VARVGCEGTEDVQKSGRKMLYVAQIKHIRSSFLRRCFYPSTNS